MWFCLPYTPKIKNLPFTKEHNMYCPADMKWFQKLPVYTLALEYTDRRQAQKRIFLPV